MKKKIIYLLILMLTLFTNCYKIRNIFRTKKTQEQVLNELKIKWESNIIQKLKSKEIDFPPSEIILIGLKEEKKLEVWVKNNENKFIKFTQYKVLAASGSKGPKLREGDKQVPEGIYKLEYLNPNSSYHLSMKLNYPNEFDLQKAKEEGRDKPGSDIFIHGKNVSIGCLAIGDEAIEELYYLVSRVGLVKINVIIAPFDFRINKPSENLSPIWLDELYIQIQKVLERFI